MRFNYSSLLLPLTLCLSGAALAASTVARASFDTTLEADANRVAQAVTQQFQLLMAPLDGEAPKCGDTRASTAWIRALSARGDLKGCYDFAIRCGALQSSIEGLDDVYYFGASCAEGLFHFKEAHALYEQATASSYAGAPNFVGHVFGYARFAHFTEFQSEVPAILQRNVAWRSDADTQLVLDAIDYLATGDSKQQGSARIDSWIDKQITQGDATLKTALVLGWDSHLLKHKYLYAEALQFFLAHLNELDNPHTWMMLAYQLFYDQDQANFRLARRVYDAYLPFAHARSQLPTEINTYGYDELYLSACREHLSQGSVFKQFQKLKNDWATGSSTSEHALTEALSLATQYPRAADLLALIGGIQDHLGHEDSAAASFWQAHQLCPYFDRAHWGLERILFRQKARAFADYSAALERIDREIAGIVFPIELSKYVINWAFLTPEAQKRLRYAIRFWAPYVTRLYQSGARLYVKAGVQFLSDVPGLEDLRNTRITYDRDNRLWDDVRGSGGKTVAVDLDQMMDGAFGDFNLAGHEITHQFQGQSAAESIFPQDQFNCSVALYDAAKRRAQFADPYAGRNFLEYLAQGVAYSMIPADSPARYGLNVSWIRSNDSDLLEFLKALQSQSSELGKIRCPITH